MSRYVVDTNVPIVANGVPDRANGGRSPALACRVAAVQFLQKLLSNGTIVLDLEGMVQAEYHRHLKPRGEPGVGDRFYLEVLRSSPSRVERVSLPLSSNGEYLEFPNDAALSTFDPSDRKFVALSHKTKAPIVVTIDRGWVRHNVTLATHGVTVEFLCGTDRAAWFDTSLQV